LYEKGDAADSIPGLRNVGRITAKKLIDQWHSDIDHIVEVPLYRIALLDKARDYYRECGYSDEYFDEMLDLVTILTTPKIYKVHDGSYTEI
jgi:5'-3' exonuclease